MPLSNTAQNILAAYPYWDDFDPTKRFHRILHRPKLPVQTRELNQVQSMLQHQVEELTTGIFKDGAAVRGGAQTLANNVIALQLRRDDTIDIATFYDANTCTGLLVQGQTSGAEAQIVQIARQSDETYTAFIVVPLNTVSFANNETINILERSLNSNNEVVSSVAATMTLAPTPTREAVLYSVDAGVFFLRGHLVEVAKQSIVLSSNGKTVSSRIGFVITEEVLDESDDTSLLDPALGTTNYAAPGAHRLRLTATLAAKSFVGLNAVQQNADEDFTEIARVVNGALVVPDAERLDPTFIEDTLARRTYDESGDYVVRPFRLMAKAHNPSINIPNATGTLDINATSNTVLAGGLITSNTVDGLGNITNYYTLFDSELAVGDILLVGNERRSVTEVLSNTSCKINATFSLSYTNAAFSIITGRKMNLELEAGKAYVRGYEFETVGTTRLEVPKPRTTVAIDNGVVQTAFGPYLFVTRANGLFDTSTSQLVDLHCTPFTLLSNSTATGYDATRIGSARVRAMVYSSGTGNGATVYKLHLVGAQFATKTLQINASASNNATLTANLSISGSNVTLVQTATVNLTSVLARSNGAYNGAMVSLAGVSGGTFRYGVVNSTSTVSGNTVTTVLTLDSTAYLTTGDINVAGNVVFTFSDKCIRGLAANIGMTQGANVHVLSQLGNVPTGNTVLYGADRTPLLFKIRESWVKPNTISDVRYDALYRFSGVAASGGTYALTFPGGLGNTVTFRGETVVDNYTISNSTAVINVATATCVLSNGSKTATINVGGDLGAIDVLARVQVVPTATRTKTLYRGNTSSSSINATGGIFNSNLNNNFGHVAVNAVNTSSRIVGLGVADVYRVQKVYATSNVANAVSWTDVTTRYDLDNGQRDWCYDHASLVLKPGYTHGGTALLAVIDRFVPSTNDGVFTAASYVGSGLTDDYADIPIYTDPVTGKKMALRDRLDFRPVRDANTTFANTGADPYTANSTTTSFATQVFPFPDGQFSLDYEYYLPRVDKVVLTKAKELKVIQGVPDVQPVAPPDPEDGMTLYTVSYPPYVTNPELVQIQAVDHRRYTMRDIGRLEKRIEHLEYYVQLSLLEDRTLSTPEFDENDLERFKNGILVDPFASHAVADVTDVDYAASIDEKNRELRPSFAAYGFRLGKLNNASSNNVVRTGDLVTLNYTQTAFITQPLASKQVSVNPFNVTSWNGKVSLSPSSDVWMDVVTLPTVTVNMFNENDNWQQIGFGTVWNEWETIWAGTQTQTSAIGAGVAIDLPDDNDPRLQWVDVTIATTTSTTTTGLQRTGSEVIAKASTIERDLGEKVVDIAVVPYMRAANVVITGTGLKPGASLTAFFDDKDVTGYIERAVEVEVANSAIASTFIVGQSVTTNASGTATIAGINGNVIRLVDTHGSFVNGALLQMVTLAPQFWQGTTVPAGSNVTAVISAYRAFSGQVASATASTIGLDVNASTVNGAYVGEVLSITTGTGAGQRVTITSYDGALKIAGVTPSFSQTPTSSSRYSIGAPKTDGLLSSSVGSGYDATPTTGRVPGTFVGMFRLPSGMFNTGRRMFRLTDSRDTQRATTIADGVFESSGTTKKVERTVVRTRDVAFETRPRTDTTTQQVSSTTTVVTATPTGVYVDPLAQTFLVDPTRFPEGVFITAIDLFFGAIATTGVPLMVQIRPTINGYPSSDIVLAEAIKTFPTEFNVVPSNTTPNPDNSAHRTRFTFPEPVFVAPGTEYAIAILSNSSEYEVFVGEINKQIIGDTRVISEQPYGGSLFKSQNGRTWTAEQAEDLMFVIHRADFSTASGIAAFNLAETINSSTPNISVDPSGHFEYDVVNVQTGHLDFGSTVNNTSHLLRIFDLTDDATQMSMTPERNITLLERHRVRSGNATCVDFRTNMRTTNGAVSPVLDLQRLEMTAVRNIIDDGKLYANGFVIRSGGSGYANSFTITLSDGHGTGAVATATVTANAVTAITMSSNGSGYIETPTLTYSGNAVIEYRGETSAKCDIIGEQKARYISRRVKLADGFDASDLKVYISANRPPNTDIDVYYKVLATGDPQTFDQKSWTRMRLKTDDASVYAGNARQFRDYEYRTASNTAAYTSNGTTFDRFHTFAIKIVMRSTSTVIVPRLRNLRALALDA